MSRKRMIDPGIWTDDGFMELSPRGRLLWIGMVSHADDEGRGQGSAKGLKAAIFPSDELSKADLEELRAEVAAAMRVVFYAVDGQEYYQLQKWAAHQSINKPTESSIPSVRSGTVLLPERSRSTTVVLPEDSGSTTVQRKKEGKKEGKAPEGAPEHPSDSRSWCLTWYREFTRRTARALEPGPEAYASASRAWKRAAPDTLLASVPRYFEHPFWFTAPKRGTAREWSFGNYLAHLEDVISSLGSGAAPPKAPSTKVLRCPNGHAYLPGQTCRECGWKEGSDADDF